MVSFKLLTLLLSFYLLTQVYCEPLAGPLDDKNETDIIDIATATLKALETIVDGISRFSFVTINSLESVIKSLEEVVLKMAKAAINQLGDELFKKLDELKEGANVIAVDIIDCTEDREEDLKELLVSFVNKTGDCAVDRVNEVLDSFAVVVTDVETVNEEIKNITLKLDDCKNASNVTDCVTQVMEEIEKATNEKPPKLTEDVELIMKKFDELVDYLFECNDNAKELEMKSQEIYNGVVECVEEKINLTVMEEIEKAADDIPAKLNEDVELAKKRVDELVNYLFECEHDNINELEMKSQEIYNGIVECVEKKINPTVINVP